MKIKGTLLCQGLPCGVTEEIGVVASSVVVTISSEKNKLLIIALLCHGYYKVETLLYLHISYVCFHVREGAKD